MSLRKRIADSAWLHNALVGLLAGYIRIAKASGRWQKEGFEDLDAHVEAGKPVIGVLWHARLPMAPFMFNTKVARLCILTSSSRLGRMVGSLMVRFDLDTIPMSSHKREVALSREVLGRIRKGDSIGIASDGPRGPARVSKLVPIMWARSSGARVFLVSFSARHALRLPTWDRTILPLPFSRGVLLCREWTRDVPRKADPATYEALRKDLEDQLNALTDEADRRVGRTPDPRPQVAPG